MRKGHEVMLCTPKLLDRRASRPRPLPLRPLHQNLLSAGGLDSQLAPAVRLRMLKALKRVLQVRSAATATIQT